MKLHPAFIVLSIAFAGLLVFFIASYSKPPKEAGTVLSGVVLKTAIDDVVISATVKSALRADPLTSDLAFKVKTRRGKVQLDGFVETQLQIDRTLAVTRAVSGVKGIKIVIGPNNRSMLAGQQGDTITNAAAAENKARQMLLANANAKSFGDAANVTVAAVPEN